MTLNVRFHVCKTKTVTTPTSYGYIKKYVRSALDGA